MSSYIDKDADNLFSIHPLLKKRYSPRAFEDKAVEEEKLDQIFEAARWAPSSRNIQPWRFIVGIKGKPSVYDRIYESLAEFNQKWNNNTPVLITIVSRKTDDKGRINSTHEYDTGQAAAYLTFQLMELGLYAHQMGGFDQNILRRNFDISDDYKPIAIMAVGYKGPVEVLPESFREMEVQKRVRKDPEDIVLRNGWEEK